MEHTKENKRRKVRLSILHPSGQNHNRELILHQEVPHLRQEVLLHQEDQAAARGAAEMTEEGKQ